MAGPDPTNGGSSQFGWLALLKFLVANPAALPTVVVAFLGYEFHLLMSALITRLDQQTALLQEILRLHR